MVGTNVWNPLKAHFEMFLLGNETTIEKAPWGEEQCKWFRWPSAAVITAISSWGTCSLAPGDLGDV